MDRKTESFSKIIGPNISRVFLRKRLLRLLENGRKKPLIWVHGPAGAGKTTLVGSYLKEHGLPVLWYQVDEKDDDVANLFFYLKKAKEEAFPDDNTSLPLLTPEYLAGLTTFARRYFEQLYSIPKGPCVIVFDNYQDAPFESMFHEILCEGLSVIPKDISVVLISRKAPHPALSRFRRSGEMKIIGWDDLCLTNAESIGVAGVLGSGGLDDEVVEQLNDRAEGWISGLLLMLGNVNRSEKSGISFVDTAPEMMFDYFSNEIFQKMDRGTRDFLATTAILPHMTATMAEKLTGNKGANGILAQLNHNNFFVVIKEEKAERVYQYHQLYREFLLSTARETLEPATFIKLQKRAAGLLEESGQVLEAGELYYGFKAWPELGLLICRSAEMIMARGMNQLLWRWLKSIPNDLLEKDPWLLYWQGATHMLINPSEGMLYFKSAFQGFKAVNDKKGQIVAIAGVIDAITNELNDLSSLKKWLDELGRFNDVLKFSNPGKIEFQVSGIIFFAMVLAYPDHPIFDKWFNMMLSFYKKSANPSQKILIAWPLGVHYYWIGDFANTKLVAETLQKLSKTEQITPLTFILAKITASLCFFVTADFEEAVDEANAGLEMSRTSGVRLWDLMLLTYCIGGSIGLGNLEDARAYLKKAEPIIKKDYNNHHGMAYHMMVSWEAILRRDYTNAKMHAELSLKLGMVLKATLTLALGHYQVSQVSHKLGEYKKADNHLDEAFKIAARMKSAFIEFMCRIGKAQYAFDRGGDKSAIKLLREAMELGRENNFENFYYWQPDVMAKLCVKALENGIENEYVKGLIRSRSLVPETPPINLPEWPYRLKICALGRFAIVKDDKPMEFSGKTPRKPLTMLKTLIAYGDKGVNEHRLADMIWPDAEGDAAQNAFYVTLKRLRELIGIEGAVNFQDGRVTINACLCWIDAWDFERMVAKIDNEQIDVWNNETPIETIKLAESAINIYNGHFLGDDIKNVRLSTFAEGLRSKFINCVNNLGYYFEQGEDFKSAIRCYQNGVRADTTQELFYQRLMVCYQRMGRNAIAIDTYEQCKKVIKTALGANVSKETMDIYTAIALPG